MINKTLICLGLGLTLPLAVQAEVKANPQAAISALSQSVSSADDAIRFGQAQGAINALASSVAQAEVSIALADAGETIYAASDEQILAELDYLLGSQPADEANALIVAVVSERPLLASAVQDMALQAGMDEAMVASSIVTGLGDAPATAAGQ